MIIDKWVEFVMSSWFTARVSLSEQQWSGALWDVNKYGDGAEGFISAFQASLITHYPNALEAVQCNIDGPIILIKRSCKPFGLLQTLKSAEDRLIQALTTCSSDGRAARELKSSLEAIRIEIDDITSDFAPGASELFNSATDGLGV